MTRINAALARIDAVRLDLPLSVEIPPATKNTDSARVMALVNAHEKLREEVADTIGELDSLIEELDGE